MPDHQQLRRRHLLNRLVHVDGLVARVPGPDSSTTAAEPATTAPNTNTAPAGTTSAKSPVTQTSAAPAPTTPTTSPQRTPQTTPGNTTTRASNNTNGNTPTDTPTSAGDSNTDTSSSTGTDAPGTTGTRTQAQQSDATATDLLSTPALSGTHTQTIRGSATLSSSHPSVTADEPQSTGGATNAIAVIGGVVGFIIGIVVLTFVVRKLVSLKRGRKAEPDQFDASDFRRSALLINDPSSHADAISRGFSPRPPSMLERRFNSSPTLRQGFDEYPSMPHQQPSYPEPVRIVTPHAAAFGPFDSPFDGAPQNPYVAHHTAPGVAVYPADYSAVNQSSQVSTPVTASFESPAFFAPVNTDNEPLYSPTDREFDMSAYTGVAADTNLRPSEEYVRAAAANGYTLPSDTNGA